MYKCYEYVGGKVVQPPDLYLGATVPIYGYGFIIHDADDYTLRHMEDHCKLWTYSALPAVLNKLSRCKELLVRTILCLPGLSSIFVDLNTCFAIFKKAGLTLVKQEIMTMMRVLDPRRIGSVKLTKILKFIMTNNESTR